MTLSACQVTRGCIEGAAAAVSVRELTCRQLKSH
jgi:hypothetical protein